ncbi:MAG: hypothetical protein ACFFCZ_17845 [Promethearchaeota archaeon]
MLSPLLEVIGVLLLGFPVVILFWARRNWIQRNRKFEAEMEKIKIGLREILKQKSSSKLLMDGKTH